MAVDNNCPSGSREYELHLMREFKEEVVYPNEFESFEEAKNEVDHFITMNILILL